MKDKVLDILIIVLPLIALMVMVYIMLKNYYNKEERSELYKLRAESGKKTLPMRLQACERLTLFVNRISPSNLVPKLQRSSSSASDLQSKIINTIKSEFEHNITQQLYVSNKAWNGVVYLKDDIINITRAKYKEVGNNATALDLGKAILQYYIDNGDNVITPNQAIEGIKQEVKKLFT